jgi:uncharacterized membrane protein
LADTGVATVREFMDCREMHARRRALLLEEAAPGWLPACVFVDAAQSTFKKYGGTMVTPREPGEFPISAGIFLGLGLGGFFDGIVFHQLLQWHHMLTSAGYPPDSVPNLEINTFWDGLFHSLTYIFLALGILILWKHERRTHLRWSGKLILGSVLMGFGIFNLAEGVVNHHLLGLHHVNETVPPEQWIFWDIGFLLWGAAMLIGGWALVSARRKHGEVPISRRTSAAHR